MKKTLAVLIMAVALSGVSYANEVAPPVCVSGTFQSYIDLTDGCTVGDKVFTDFGYTSSGDNALSANQLTVTPDSSDPMNPGLLFTGSWVASEGTTSDSKILFNVSTVSGEALIEDASLSITGYGTNGGGIVTVAENLCLGGTFLSFTTSCSSEVIDNLLVSTAIGQSFDHTTFTPVSSVDVIKDIGLTAFGDGETDFAFTSGVSNHFSQVPEPATLTLFGTGLLALGEKIRRRRKAAKK